MLRSFALAAAALVLYPGLLTAGAFGLAAELASRRAAGMSLRIRRGRTRLPAAAVGAAVLGAIAAAQLPAPLSPADPADRNLLVAIAAVGTLAWIAWAWGTDGGGLALPGGLAAWTVALLAPAVLAQDLHPQVVAVQVLGGSAPLRVAAGILYVASLPVLLGLVDGPAQPWERLWLWLPLGGLFAGVFVPGSAEDALGLARYFAAAGLVLAGAALVGVLVRRAGVGPRYPLFLGLLTAATAALAVVGAFYR